MAGALCGGVRHAFVRAGGILVTAALGAVPARICVTGEHPHIAQSWLRWVRVTGTWIPGTGRPATGPAVFEAGVVAQLAEAEDPCG